MNLIRTNTCGGVLGTLAMASLAFGTNVEVIVQEGDSLGGSTVSLIGAPKVDAEGNVGLIFGLADGRRGIWRGLGAVFFSDDPAVAELSGGETTIGIGNGGKWIYSPSIDPDGAGGPDPSGDGIWSSEGFIIVENTPAPDFPANFNTTFHSRPYMTDAGTMYWVSGLNDGAGGTSSQERMLYKRDANTGTIGTVLRAGDVIGATEVAPFGGINFDYSFSYDDNHSILEYTDAIRQARRMTRSQLTSQSLHRRARLLATATTGITSITKPSMTPATGCCPATPTAQRPAMNSLHTTARSSCVKVM